MRSQALILIIVILSSLAISQVFSDHSMQINPLTEVKNKTSFSQKLYLDLANKANDLEMNFMLFADVFKYNTNVVGEKMAISVDVFNASKEEVKNSKVLMEEFLEKKWSDAANASQKQIISATWKVNNGVLNEYNHNQNNLKIEPLCDQKAAEEFNLTSKIALAKYFDPEALNNKNIIGMNLYELNVDKRWPIASVTKLMTTVIALEKMDLKQQIKMSETAVNSEGVAGDFRVGEIYTLRDLIKAMLITSSNDAATAIAEAYGKKEFIDEMQRKASELKMFQTTYIEETGLSFVNQSTANDLVKLANYIYQNHQEILKISRDKDTVIKDLKSGNPRMIFNINTFAGSSDFIGGKTGFIDEAGRNLVALFSTKNGAMIITNVLGSENSFQETAKLKNLINQCQL